MNLNKEILIYLNSLWSNIYIENISRCFADTPIFFLPIFLLVSWIYYSIKKINKKEKLLFIFYSTVIAISISLIIQNIITIERPETVINWTGKLLLKHIPDASFPSDHASIGFAFLIWLYLADYKKIFWWFLPFAILMVISRIIVWVHWPLDILVWIIVWILWAIISFKLLPRYKFVNNLNNLIIKIMWYIKL